MVIVLYPDDLVYNFEGNKKRPALNDFPAIENIDFGPFDVILYKNGHDELTLKSPLPPETGDFDRWHDLQRFLGRGKLVEEKSKEDPDVKYIKSIDNIDMENAILQGYRDTIQQLNAKINNLEYSLKRKEEHIIKLELQIKGFSAVKQKLTELKIKVESMQDELIQLSNYLLNRKKSLKVRNNSSEGMERRLERLSSKLTEIYALILTLLESILYEPAGSDNTYTSIQGATNISGKLYAEILDKIGSKGLRNVLIMLSPNSSEVRSALNNVVDDIVQKLETEEKWEKAKMGLLVSDDIKDEEEAFDAFTNGNFQAAWLLFKS